jgi:hypothetical protein
MQHHFLCHGVVLANTDVSVHTCMKQMTIIVTKDSSFSNVSSVIFTKLVTKVFL